ncbi:MAG: hypothetical protein Q7Q73_15325 [Verrucomicrobiota bacterium JB024]|nr:hypothetical protein [Verrucomicrobiota bacterium JB024]
MTKEKPEEPIWPPSKQTLKVGATCYMALLVGLTAISFYKENHAEVSLPLVRAVFGGVIGATVCFLSVLLFIYYPFKIIPRIASWVEVKARQTGDERSANRGRLITQWGLRLYLIFLIALDIPKISRNEGRNWGWVFLGWLVVWWFSSLIKQGVKPAKNVASFFLILGVISVFTRWKWINEHPEVSYGIAFSLYGFILGLVLLLSKDVNYYVALQSEKLPKSSKKKWKKR